MKTAKYRKRCFDQIEGIVAENKALSAEVDRLRSEVGEKVAEMSAQEEHRLELTRRLANQYRQREGQSRTSRRLYVTALVDFADLGDYSCRLGGGGRAPSAGERAAQPRACRGAEGRAPSRGGVRPKGPGVVW